MFDTNFFNNVFKFCEGQIEIRPLPGQPGFFDLDDHAGIDSHCSKHEASNLYFGVGTIRSLTVFHSNWVIRRVWDQPI